MTEPSTFIYYYIMKLKQLIALLKTKPQIEDVEFIIVTKAGRIVAMDIEANAHDIAQLLRAFGKK